MTNRIYEIRMRDGVTAWESISFKSENLNLNKYKNLQNAKSLKNANFIHSFELV